MKNIKYFFLIFHFFMFSNIMCMLEQTPPYNDTNEDIKEQIKKQLIKKLIKSPGSKIYQELNEYRIDEENLLNLITTKSIQYIETHKDYFSNINEEYLNNTQLIQNICSEILPYIINNQDNIIENAPTLFDDIKKHPKKYISIVSTIISFASIIYLLKLFGYITEENIEQVLKAFNNTAKL
ncbi:hypothetical protein GF322_00375 [Candidatus Dependentiae bacterium]|nr:hypothetical protein [Candidatus Dependentiae bacterium]